MSYETKISSIIKNSVSFILIKWWEILILWSWPIIFLFNLYFYLLSDKYNLPALDAMIVKYNYSFNDITLILYTALICLDVMLCYTKTYPSTSASEGHCDVMRVLRWFLPTINLHLFPFRPLTLLRLLP